MGSLLRPTLPLALLALPAFFTLLDCSAASKSSPHQEGEALDAFPGGVYTISDGQAFAIDGGFFHWSGATAEELYSLVDGNAYQQWQFTASGEGFTICNVGDGASVCLSDGGGGALAIGVAADVWTVTASGTGYTLQSQSTQGYVADAPAPADGAPVGIAAAPTTWILSSIGGTGAADAGGEAGSTGGEGGSDAGGGGGSEGGGGTGGDDGGGVNPMPPVLPSGPTYAVAAGADTAAIQSAITSAASSGGTVSLAAGHYSVTTPINIPCPSSAIAIVGPSTNYPYRWSDRPTATLLSATGGAPVFNVATPCSAGVTLAYLEVDGNRPASGGGAVYVGDGGYDHLSILYNYFHGNQERTPAPDSHGTYWVYDDSNASLIYFDGDEGGGTDADIAVSYNILGNPVAGDCSNVMQWIGDTLPNGSWAGYDSTGGACAGIGLHSSSKNLTIDHNVFQQQEQAMKFYEGGSSASTFFVQTGVDVLYNDIGFIHRIGLETQQSPTSAAAPMSYQFNDNHDQVYPSFGSWLLSSPQLTYTNATDNLMISNSAQSGSGPANFEAWGAGAYSYNLEQGNTACGADFGFGGPGDDSYNIMQLTTASPCSTDASGGTVQGIQNEFPGTIGPANFPTMVGNTYAKTTSVASSAAPTIAPASGSFSGSQVVTLADPGNATGAGPRGNTSIWYTTDGSTPAPKAGTSKYYAGPFTLTGTTTVKAVGMWGSVTQPASYPAGFGYAPSAVVSATYTAP